MPYLTLSDVEIDCSFAKNISTLLDIKLQAEVNGHSQLYFKALLRENIPTANLEKESVTLRNKRDGSILFVGVFGTVTKKSANETTRLEATCYSYTWLLDVDMRSRTFQNSKDKYKDVLKYVYQKNDGAVLVQNDKNIHAPILQYSETDWTFTLRIATMLDTVVLVNDKIDIPYVSVGFVSGKEYHIAVDDYQTDFLPLQRPRTQKSNKDDYTEFRYLHSQTGSLYNIGDYTYFDNQKYYIMSLVMVLEQSTLVFHYKLGTEFRSSPLQRINPTAEGVILTGTVLECKQELLKVHFDIDEKQTADTAMWFPYKPDTNNVFYSMPEKGAKVVGKFANGTFVIITCLHDNSADFPEHAHHYFNIQRGQQLAMLPTEIFFLGNANKATINDVDGVSFFTKEQLLIESLEDIRFSAKKTRFSSMEQTKLGIINSTDGIDLSANEANIYSKNLHMHSDGTNPRQYPVKDTTNSTTLNTSVASLILGTTIARINVGEST